MNLPGQSEVKTQAKHIQETKLLADPATVSRVLKEDTSFATIAFCSEVTGPVREKMYTTPNGRFTSWTWEGIDENKILIGYLSHNTSNLRFQTKEATVFDLTFSDVNIEEHVLGLLVKTATKSFIIGNYMAINEQLSPESKMNYNFGSESVIWVRELSDLGVIDKASWQKTKRKDKFVLALWFVLVIVLTAIYFLH